MCDANLAAAKAAAVWATPPYQRQRRGYKDRNFLEGRWKKCVDSVGVRRRRAYETDNGSIHCRGDVDGLCARVLVGQARSGDRTQYGTGTGAGADEPDAGAVAESVRAR
jgi:hypothetical protein